MTHPSPSKRLHSSSIYFKEAASCGEKGVRSTSEMEKPGLESPLIPGHTEVLVSGADGVNEAGLKSDGEFFAEIKRQLFLAGPLIASSLLQNILQVISVMFVGHLGELALSGASMATSFAGVTGFSFLVCMRICLLCSASFFLTIRNLRSH